MVSYPKIKDTQYHEIDFKEVDDIRKKVSTNEIKFLINENELFLYMNQMGKKYKFLLSFIWLASSLFFVFTFVFLFINWRISPALFIGFFVLHVYNRKLAKQIIYKLCSADKVFLKFALAVGLVKVMSE